MLSHFQEDCALENVWNMAGLSILTSAPPMPPYVCFLCASKGQHEVTDDFYSILIEIFSLLLTTLYFQKV